MTVNILGTEYTISEKKRHKDKRLDSCDGYTDDSTKKIVVAIIEPDMDSKQDLDAVRRKIIRHELTHAFLCESGLAENSEWAQNEEIVDWIAIQGTKLYKAWQEAGAV